MFYKCYGYSNTYWHVRTETETETEIEGATKIFGEVKVGDVAQCGLDVSLVIEDTRHGS